MNKIILNLKQIFKFKNNLNILNFKKQYIKN